SVAVEVRAYCSLRKSITVKSPDGKYVEVWDPSPLNDQEKIETLEIGVPFAFRSCCKTTLHYASYSRYEDTASEHWEPGGIECTLRTVGLLGNIGALAALETFLWLVFEFLARRKRVAKVETISAK